MDPQQVRINIAESTIIGQEENLCVVGYFMLQMVATKHCCWGECKSDSRFPHLLHPALKKRLQEGKPIFLQFPKKSQGLERCLRWVNVFFAIHSTRIHCTETTQCICALFTTSSLRHPSANLHTICANLMWSMSRDFK